MNEIVQVINTVGFPIACAIGLAWYAYKTTNRILDLTEKVTKALSESAEKMSDLTDAIKKLKEE